MSQPTSNQPLKQPASSASMTSIGVGCSGGVGSVSDLIITQADIDLCLGSGELLRCPFCGERAMSTGRRTENQRAICWTVRCKGKGAIPDCTASVWATHPVQDAAREKAVARWNRRVSA